MRIKVVLPLWVTIGKKKHALSLNNYRNAHFRTLVALKKEVARIVYEQLPRDIYMHNTATTILSFYPDNNKKDLDNFCSIASKFANDAIVSAGLLRNDTTDNIKSTINTFIKIDKINPRIEIVYELL